MRVSPPVNPGSGRGGQRMPVLDAMDKDLIHLLRLDARAPFNRIADVLGTSPQTVSRRYQRLRTEFALRVVGLIDPSRTGHAQWLIRLVINPRSAQEIALALVRRPDISWVKLTSGGGEVSAILTMPIGSGSQALLLHCIPRTESIVSVSAHCLLHTYPSGLAYWPDDVVPGDKQSQPPSRTSREVPAGPPPGQALSDGDRKLLDALQRDGRAGIAELAAASGYSSATVTRRLADLQASDSISFDVEMDPGLLGAHTQALLWMSVAPAHIDMVGSALAREAEVAFAASTTGPTNLVANVLCPDRAAMHRFLADRLGALDQIRMLESSPVMRTFRRGSSAPPGESTATGTG
jgi:DNA-binding Lrp family transcriptional regulator